MDFAQTWIESVKLDLTLVCEAIPGEHMLQQVDVNRARLASSAQNQWIRMDWNEMQHIVRLSILAFQLHDIDITKQSFDVAVTKLAEEKVSPVPQQFRNTIRDEWKYWKDLVKSTHPRTSTFEYAWKNMLARPWTEMFQVRFNGLLDDVTLKKFREQKTVLPAIAFHYESPWSIEPPVPIDFTPLTSQLEQVLNRVLQSCKEGTRRQKVQVMRDKAQRILRLVQSFSEDRVDDFYGKVSAYLPSFARWPVHVRVGKTHVLEAKAKRLTPSYEGPFQLTAESKFSRRGEFLVWDSKSYKEDVLIQDFER